MRAPEQVVEPILGHAVAAAARLPSHAARRRHHVAYGLSVRHQGLVLDREVHFMRLTITWDGKEFKVERTHGSIAAGAGAEMAQPPGE